MAGAAEKLAYVVTLNTGTTATGQARRAHRRRLQPRLVDRTARSSAGWTCPTSATSCTTSAGTRAPRALCPWAPHPHVERRYLIVPGLRSSPHPRRRRQGRPAQPEARRRSSRPRRSPRKTGYSRPHTVHCGPDGIYMARSATRRRRPGRRVPARPRRLQAARALGDRPRPAAPGLRRVVEHRLRHAAHERVGHAEHGRERRQPRAAARQPVRPPAARLGPAPRRHKQAIDLGAEHQMVLELRPAHDPTKPYGFVGVVVSTADLSAPRSGCGSARRDGSVGVEKVITIPPSRPSRPAAAAR